MGCCASCCSKKAGDGEQQSLASSAPKPSALGKSSVVSKDVLRQKIESATKIKILILRECGLKQLPEEATAEGLSALTSADLSVNQLQFLPSSICTWRELKKFDASGNVLERLPDTITRLDKLEKLTLSGNRLVELPAGIGDLKLTELKCDLNSLPSLPDAFGGPISSTLVELDVSGNRLVALPGSISTLRALTRIMLQDNKVSDLGCLVSQGKESLLHLQCVNAANNQITKIESGTLRLPELSELWLKGNSIDPLVLREVEGFQEFADRRKQRLDKRIEQNVVGDVDLSMCGL